MAQPYVGEIRLFAGTFVPVGWAACDGAHLPIAEYETLFQLIGTTYGGDGETTFALPNLSSRVPIHTSPAYILGASGGVEEVTLTATQIPAHSHALAAGGTGIADLPTGRILATPPEQRVYAHDAATVPLATQAVAPAGGFQPHDNLMPYLCINFIISLYGIFPSPT